MAQVRGIPTGSNIRYLDFLAPGILAQSVLFAAIFYGIAAIWERDLGVLHRYLVSPAPRSALVLGKAVSAGVRGLSQAVVVYLLALAHWAFRSDLSPLNLLAVLGLIALGSGLFSTFSLIIACIVQDARAVHGHRPGADDADLLRQQRDLPARPHAGLAAGDLAAQPADLRSGRAARPDAARGGQQVRHRLDCLVLVAFSTAFVAIATRAYPRMTR